MRKAIVFAMSVLMAGSLILSGCSSKPDSAGETADESKAVEGGTLIVRAIGDPMSFNPDLNADDYYYPAAQNMFHRLTKMDADKNIIPDLATDWEWSDDSLTLTFHLQDGVKWSDGEDVTSEDVKYTFETIKNVETSCPFNSNMSVVDSIDAPDDQTVVFHLNTPNVSLVSNLGWYGTFILPEHVFNNGQSWAENEATTKAPVTSGNFKFDEYKAGESLKLVKSEYAKTEPALDAVVFSIIPDETTAVQALVNGEIDVYEAVPTASQAQLLADDSIDMYINEYPSPMRIVFNTKNEILSDAAVRKAIALSVNRDEISEKIFDGLWAPEYSMYPSLIEWAANTEDTAPEYDLEEASKVLEEAGYTKDADGYYVRGLKLLAFEGSGFPDAAKLIASSAKEAGVEITVEVMEYNAWSDAVYTNREFDIEIQGGFIGPDPSALLPRVGEGGSDNVGEYANPDVDAALKQGGSIGDEAERAEYYKEAQKLLSEDLPYVPIVAYACYDASRANVKNLPIEGAGKWGWAEYTYTEFTE
ncbi:MAG: ABC transporter substrate-binding protein [Eubacteriales bacterium]|nr:ABC transporter substrate-binding protein [Eubacteriales bacterium]